VKRERRAVLLLALAFLTGLLVFTPEGAVSSTIMAGESYPNRHAMRT